MVGHTLFCLLAFFLLKASIYCGHTEDAVLTLNPNWSILFSGESVSFTCDTKEGQDKTWNYTISRYESHFLSCSSKTSCLFNVTRNDSGEYQCIGHSIRNNVTKMSNKINLTVLDKPRPVLTVSPSWLSPGASVTLSCEVEHPSAGWRFYWYKTVANLSGNYYKHMIQHDRRTVTEQNSSIIHGQTHTAGYVCRAGRGDPVYYINYSKAKFVWSGDFDSGSASVKVKPATVQHFSDESVSLSCEGKSTEWRVVRFSKTGRWEICSAWGTMNGSTCNFSKIHNKTAVYWCESGSGEFSNAVNLTVQSRCHIFFISMLFV
ncbi:carcinoembryonic antigen-related cell adhesion molecule 1-like [Channa argus]|uniref:carcinoembryonic antigen-related cell adhesion molecule 1-like n=1 Tax=Channa argus TaxID=215402 RepID=UPI00352240DB